MSNIQLFKVRMNENTKNEVSKTLDSGMITQGKKVEEFEQKLKEWFGYPYLLTVNSATSGLTLAYRLLDAKHVISTPLTCFATTTAILANNCDIVWADVDPDTCNIDLEDVKRKLTKNTNVLSFVHWGGSPVDLVKVEEVKKYAKNVYDVDLKVVEDCAHALGAEFDGRKLGKHGNIAVYSLQAIKHLTTGDGGIIVLPDEQTYRRAKLLRWFGIDRDRRSLPGTDFRLEPDILEYGYKFHMNDLNATIGIENLKNIDDDIEKHSKNGEFYNAVLKDLPNIELLDSYGKSSYWIYTLKTSKKAEFCEFMIKKGVVVSQVHARNDKHSCVIKYKAYLPQLDILENQIISIPSGWWLSEENRDYIVRCVYEFSLGFSIIRNPTEYFNDYTSLLFQLNGFKGEEYNENFSMKDVYCIIVNGKMVSCVKFFFEDKLYSKVGHIEDVVTDKDHRKKGYSQWLLKYVTAIGMMQGYKVVLYCRNEMADFYEKCQFKKTGLSFSIRNSR